MDQEMIGARSLAYLRGERDLDAERQRLAELKRQVKGSSGLAFWLCDPQKRRVQRFWQVVSLLQENSRISLTEMSKQLDVPISSLFELMKEVEKFFLFTIVLREGERDRIAKKLPAEFELSYDFTADKEAEIPLTMYA